MVLDAVDIRKEYLKWLCSLVHGGEKWSFLWNKLHNMAFVWLIPMDENRAEDGKYLRYLFGLELSEQGISAEEIEEILDGPCSVMEFLVGLARRIEEDIMYDVDKEDRTYEWFWEMIRNLGLDIYDDEHYSEARVDDIVNRFMSRKYKKNGVGNVFKWDGKHGTKIRNFDIWSQVHFWATEKSQN